jgi:hypothetical protein
LPVCLAVASCWVVWMTSCLLCCCFKSWDTWFHLMV